MDGAPTTQLFQAALSAVTETLMDSVEKEAMANVGDAGPAVEERHGGPREETDGQSSRVKAKERRDKKAKLVRRSPKHKCPPVKVASKLGHSAVSTPTTKSKPVRKDETHDRKHEEKHQQSEQDDGTVMLDSNTRIKSGINTQAYSDLIMFCKEKETEENELEEYLQRFLNRRAELRKKLPDPWTRMEELADTTLNLENLVASLRSNLVHANESAIVYKTEADKWKNVAQRIDFEESQSVREHKEIVNNLEEELGNKEKECEQLRAQRVLLKKQVGEKEERLLEMEQAIQQARSERDSVNKDLMKWKRAAQNKAQQVGLSMKGAREELQELRAFKEQAEEKLDKAHSERVKLQGDLFAMEKQFDETQERLEKAYLRSDVLSAQLLEKTHALQEKALKSDQGDLELSSLKKRLQASEDRSLEMQEKLEVSERGRITQYQEQEARVEQVYVQLEEAKEREDRLKQKLASAKDATHKAELDGQAREEELLERISNLESTLNGLLKNMQTIREKNTERESASKKEELPFRYLDHEHDEVDGDLDSSHVGQNVVSEKANQIRMEIKAAAEKAWQQQHHHQQQEEQDEGKEELQDVGEQDSTPTASPKKKKKPSRLKQKKKIMRDRKAAGFPALFNK